MKALAFIVLGIFIGWLGIFVATVIYLLRESRKAQKKQQRDNGK